MSRAPTRDLLCGLLLAALAPCPTAARADAAVEYVDTEYQFRFRFPAGWERQELPVPGEGGEVRVAVKSLAEPMFVMAVVSPIGESISREEFARSPDRDAVVARMIERALDQVHGKMARDLAASQTIVAGKHARASDVGIAFSIDTTQITPDGATAVAGVHVVPFGKRYSIALLMVSRVDGAREKETRRRLFDSFQVHGERLPGVTPSRRGSGG